MGRTGEWASPLLHGPTGVGWGTVLSQSSVPGHDYKPPSIAICRKTTLRSAMGCTHVLHTCNGMHT